MILKNEMNYNDEAYLRSEMSYHEINEIKVYKEASSLLSNELNELLTSICESVLKKFKSQTRMQHALQRETQNSNPKG